MKAKADQTNDSHDAVQYNTVQLTVPCLSDHCNETVNKKLREEYGTALQQGSPIPGTELFFHHTLLCCHVLGVNGCKIE
jgi:hypothetical protein